MRYDKTERLGVIATDQIITKEIGWIFREQPIIDVGLDAIIEQSEDGNPTGRFIAVQIKTGKGNFQITENKITYYVSNIHYNYWINLEIPIIIVAHFPDNEKTYWLEINKQTLKRTKKKWKLEIPKYHELSIKAKKGLTEILSSNSKKSFAFELYKGKLEPDTIFDIVENVNCISESIENVKNFINILFDFEEKTNSFNDVLHKQNERGLTTNDLEVKASIKGYARQMNTSSMKIENEIIIFAKLFSVGFYAFEQVIIINYLISQNYQEFEAATGSIRIIPNAIDSALNGINKMKESASKLPNKFSVLKEAKIRFLEVIEMIIFEYNEAKMIAQKIIDNLENKK